MVFVPESDRRKKDIDLVDPNHPLALHCLKDDDTERPSADELCGRLATLKGEQMYKSANEQHREIRELHHKQEPQKAPQATPDEPQKVPKPALAHVTVQVSI